MQYHRYPVSDNLPPLHPRTPPEANQIASGHIGELEGVFNGTNHSSAAKYPHLRHFHSLLGFKLCKCLLRIGPNVSSDPPFCRDHLSIPSPCRQYICSDFSLETILSLTSLETAPFSRDHTIHYQSNAGYSYLYREVSSTVEALIVSCLPLLLFVV